IKERFEDLSFLNDSDARFQMMWSDPSSAEIIPPALQEQSARFPFGRLQAASFLQRIGCHSLIRGHEKVEAGYAETYRDDHVTLITVFSAGGVTNDDLPEGSSYRTVVPHALTIRARDSDVEVAPWEIQYEKYNDPSHNAFFKAPMQIAHRQD
ncbi:MAG: serine/threonine protein phosphatase, partial [Myxococcota bacterium]